MTFASCANSSDSDDENPSPTLPANVGENPIKETVRLLLDGERDRYLELKTDGTALYICEDKSEEVQTKFKYTYDADAKRICMRVEKSLYYDIIADEIGQLLTYDELRSRINEDYTIEKARQSLKKDFEEYKNSEYFKEDYPDCSSYDDYEAALAKELGVGSFEAWVEYWKQEIEYNYKVEFGAQITYSYKITDDKITLTEKFTGVKNMLNSSCRYRAYDDSQIDTDVRIYCTHSSICIYENDVRYDYDGSFDTDKKTIDFVKQKRTKSDNGKYEYETIGHVNATYTEDIDRGRVTINCEGKKYVCEFEGQKYTQVE